VTNSLAGLLVLNPDVIVVPVDELPDDTKSQIDHDPGDYALSRPQARTGSKVIDADAAALVSRFSQPRSVSEAVILFARERELDPMAVLEGAHALVRTLVDGGFLLRSDAVDDARRHTAQGPLYPVGTPLLGGTVQRTLAVLEDTELAVLGRDGAASVVKIDRTAVGVDPSVRAMMAARVRHEAAYLAHLDGTIAPRLVNTGAHDDRCYIEMELVHGVDAAAAAAEARTSEGEPGRHALLGLARQIARAYSNLHQRGVLHGDVHPRNVLIESSGLVRLVDFGVASTTAPHELLPTATVRGGIPFFFEPELARSSLARTSVFASEAGEQYAVAALLWFLVTGSYCQQFRLGRDAMLEDIATGALRSFAECGAAPWPALEAVLTRALAKDPRLRFASMDEFSNALESVDTPQHEAKSARWCASRAPLDEAIASATPEGAWWNSTLTPGPAASITYGAAGIAMGMLHIAQRRNEATALAVSDLWARRALRESRRDDAFHNAAIQITPEVVGGASPFHAVSGVHAVAALVAAAQGDPVSQAEAVAEFVASTGDGSTGLDLTVGLSSVALGAALILDELGPVPSIDVAELRARGDQAIASMWCDLDARPSIAKADIEYLGIAHGWAGFLYASLLWSERSGSDLPEGVERRLTELARLAMPTGRGAEWPWMLHRGSQMTMPGWCNGTCGYVFLWNLAHRRVGRTEYAALADRAAWHAWEAPEPGPSLCCGLSGRAYSLLNHYRHTGDAQWRARAEQLAHRALVDPDQNDQFPHSLYKGRLGLAILLADLDCPEESSMPFFEPSPRR